MKKIKMKNVGVIKGTTQHNEKMTITTDYKKMIKIGGNFYYVGTIKNAFGWEGFCFTEAFPNHCRTKLKLKEDGFTEFYEVEESE